MTKPSGTPTEVEKKREELRRPPCWGPNDKGDMMVDMEVESYEADLDVMAWAAERDVARQRTAALVEIADAIEAERSHHPHYARRIAAFVRARAGVTDE